MMAILSDSMHNVHGFLLWKENEFNVILHDVLGRLTKYFWLKNQEY